MAFALITVLVLAIGGVSGKLSPAKVYSLLHNPENEQFALNFEFFTNHSSIQDGHPVHITFLDRNGLSASQKVDIKESQIQFEYVLADFSRPISMDILLSESALNHLQRAYPVARALIVPGSIRQLEEAVDDKDRKLNESSKDPRSTHTLCFWFGHFKVKESKINAIIDYASEENLHCLSLPTNHSGLMLNFDYKSPHGEFKRSIHFFWNPKRIFTYQLSMDLKNVRLVEELTRFMQIELKNPSVKIMKCEDHTEDDIQPFKPPASSHGKLFGGSAGYSNHKPEDRPGWVEFENEFEFSNETKQFISELCNRDNENNKDRGENSDLNKERGEKNDSYKEYVIRSIVSDWSCPHEIRNPPKGLSFDGELLISYRP